jgi:hypothetical protein
LACSQRRERKGERRERGGIRAAAAAAGERGEEERKGGRREADRWDTAVGAAVKKKKGRGGQWVGAGIGLGRLGRKEPALVLFFFLFPFSNFIFKSFSTQIQFKLFQTFLKNFIDFFRNHTSNQTPCKPKDDAHTLVVSKFIKLSLIFLELNLNRNLISFNP